MVGHYITAGLELFKRSQLAIFDKALSLVDLFDSAVSDSVYAMQDIYPHPYYQKEQTFGVWERFLIYLEGCVRHIRLYFFFTVAMICCTILMLRRRRRNPLFRPIKMLNHELSPRKPTGGIRPSVETSPSIHSQHSTVLNESQEQSIADLQEDQDKEDYPTATLVKEVEGPIEVKDVSLTKEPKIKKTQVIPIEEKKVVKAKVKSKPKKIKKRRSGGVLVDKKTTISNALSNILNKKFAPPVVRVKQHTNKSIHFPKKYPVTAQVKRDKCNPQNNDPAKNRAQVFILLSGLDKATSQQVTPKKRPISPKKHFSKNSTPACSPKKKNSPFTLTKIPSLRLKKPFKGGGHQASPAIGHDAAVTKEKQKKKTNIPYLHTLSPRRRVPPKAGSHNNKEVTDKHRSKHPQTTNTRKTMMSGVYLSPKSRMAKNGSETKVNSKITKRSSGSPNKRCKTCKKIRQTPECGPAIELLPIRKRTNINIGSLFCFSPQAKLPAPFHNARINSHGDNAQQLNTKSFPHSNNEGESHYCTDTNMNKAVLKFDLQNDNPNNHKMNNASFGFGKNLFLSRTSGNTERLDNTSGFGGESTRYSNCLTCNIQHNVQPVGINETRINASNCRSLLTSEVYTNQNESRRQGNVHHISVFPRQPYSRDLYHSNLSRLDNQQGGGHPLDIYSGQGTAHNILSQSPLKNFNGRDTSFNKLWQNNRIESHAYSLFRGVPKSKFELTDNPDTKMSADVYRNWKEERVNKYRKRKKEEHSRESRRRCLHEKYASKLMNPFDLLNENYNEDGVTGSKTFCKNNEDFERDLKPSNEMKYKQLDIDNTDNGSTRHYDKIKSNRWRQRHEPYRCTPSKSKSTRAESLEDLSTATFTLNSQSSKTTDTRRDNARCHHRIPKITNLAELARFTASTDDTNKDVSSSDVDPTTFSVQSASSYQNKNNCSPSRLAKPFIKPTSDIPVTTTIEAHASNIIEHKPEMETDPQCTRNKELSDLLSDWQKSGDESKQGHSKDITYSTVSGVTGPFGQEGGVGPTGEGHQQSEYSSPKSTHMALLRNTAELLQSPHSDTKLGSVRRATAPTQHSYYRPRNKTLRQHRLFNKYSLVASKVVMRAIEQSGPTYSLSGNHSQLSNSVSLGVQTSHTSLRHMAVQTSPHEERLLSGRIPVRLRHKSEMPNQNVDLTLKYNDIPKGRLNKIQVDSSPSQKYFKNVSKQIKQTSDDDGRDNAFVSDRKDESSVQILPGKKSEKETTYQNVDDVNLVSNSTRGFRVNPEANISDSIDFKAGKDMTPLVSHIRRESLPILSLSSSTVDVKSDVLVSTSGDSSPSMNLLDSTSKDWLTRPKWENANEDEVNRRVERAMRLRQELQNYRIGKTPESPPGKFKTCSLFGLQHQDVPSLTSTSTTSPNENKNDVGIHSVKTVEKKLNVSSLRKNVTLQNAHIIQEKVSSPTIGILPVRKVESSTTDTLVKTFPFIAHQAKSFVSENTSTEGNYKDIVKYGESTTETDGTSETPERYPSYQGEAACAVPDSTEVRPSSATSLSQNTTDSPRVEEANSNVLIDLHHRHHHLNHSVTKNSPPIKISKMENVIQTEYPKLVGELVQALPHVPLASFVEWFIETSNPGQFISSDESTSTAADAKEAVVKEALSTNSALESAENDRSVIYVRRDTVDDADQTKYSSDEIQQKFNATSSSSPDVNNLGRVFESTKFVNDDVLELERGSENVVEKMSPAEEDVEGNVASIKRILLTRKDSSNESTDSVTANTSNMRKIITLRQTCNDSPFEGNMP